MKRSRRRASLVIAATLALCLSFMVIPVAAHASSTGSPALKVVPTEVCSCSAQPSAPGSPTRFQPGGFGGSSVFDEQIGITFTQSFTSIEYNVTAVEQTDPLLGDGPAYLLNGLSSADYWYQVGVSWDWAPGATPGTGFDMNYEVFDSAGASVFPSNGQGGVIAFSGPVNEGDNVILNLYFSNSSKSVVMLADDPQTGAQASVTFSSLGSTYFMGLPQSVANSNGFFTGLMTEWYHGAPYYTDESEVVYSGDNSGLSSAWMWMDEFNPSTLQGIFAMNTSAPISFGDPAKLQEFSYNGTTEYADAYEFVTGSLANGTLTPTGIPLTVSFSIIGAATGYSPPTLTYQSNGTSYTVPLTQSPTVYYADKGTTWNASATLGGSTTSQRWETDQPTTGVVGAPATIQFVYYDQEYVTFGFSVSGGGSGSSTPTVDYVSFGSSATTAADTGVWADAGSAYQFSNPLPGSNDTSRWYAVAQGSIGSLHKITATYYRQYLVTFDISFKNTEVFPGLLLRSTSAGRPYSATIISGANSEWLDSGSAYTVPQSYSLEAGQRLITNGTTSGEVSGSFTVELVYEHQFYIGITQNVPGGGTVSPQSGWYDSGSTLQLEATPASGWQFEGWHGSGADSASGSTPALPLTVGPGAPSNETATFYPGVTVVAGGPVSVAYRDGSISGSVNAGSSTVVYLPPSTALNLTASSSALLTTFNGWSGAVNSSGTSTSLLVSGPVTVVSNSGYDYPGIILALAIAVSAIAATVVLARRRITGGTPASKVGGVDPSGSTGAPASGPGMVKI